MYKDSSYCIRVSSPLGRLTQSREERYFEDSSSEEEPIESASRKRKMTIKTHEMTAEDGDKSTSNGGLSDEQHPAGALSHTSTPHKVVSHTSNKSKAMTKNTGYDC